MHNIINYPVTKLTGFSFKSNSFLNKARKLSKQCIYLKIGILIHLFVFLLRQQLRSKAVDRSCLVGLLEYYKRELFGGSYLQVAIRMASNVFSFFFIKRVLCRMICIVQSKKNDIFKSTTIDCQFMLYCRPVTLSALGYKLRS